MLGELGSGQALEQPLGNGAGSSEGDPGAEGAEQTPLTREETQALIDAGIDKAIKISGRQSQSLVDKADHRISGRVSSELKSLATYAADLKAAGHEIPAEILERVKQDVLVRSITGDIAEGEGPSVKPAGQAGLTGAPGEIDSAKATGMVAVAMMEDAGCFIEETDPEFKLIKMDSTNARVFLGSIGTAIDTKKLRLAGASEDELEGDEGEEGDQGRRARISAKKKGVPSKIPDGLKPMDYLKRGYSKSKK